MAEDELFKAIGYRMELRALAMRDGIKQGLKGDDLARHIQGVINDPPEEFALKAIDTARYQTFTKPLGTMGKEVQDIARTHPAFRIIMPFIRTPSNIVKFAAERSPFGLLFKDVRDSLRKGGIERDIASSRIMMGSGLGGAITAMAAEGHITGAGPTDSRLRAALYRTGWQPYSLKIGDKYYAYSRLEPLGMLLGINADFAEIAGQIGDVEATEIAAGITGSIAKNLISKTYLRGLSELVQAVHDPDRYGERYIQNFIGTVVPTGIAQIARSEDPILRDAQSLLDKIKSRVPGYSETLPARRNLWGEPIMLSGGLGPDAVSPIYTSEATPSKIDREIVRLEAGIDMPERNIGGVELTPERYWEFVEMAGKPAKAILDTLVNGAKWDGMPDYAKEVFIRDTVRKVRDKARMAMVIRYPDLAESAVNLKIEKFSD
jgi:hypothetical protein